MREARLITKELRHQGVSPQGILKFWATVIAVPLVVILGYLLLHYDSGTADPTILRGIQITYVEKYKSHVHNGSSTPVKSVTVMCSDGGDSQPFTTSDQFSTPIQPGYGEDAYVRADCKLVRVNESHQLW